MKKSILIGALAVMMLFAFTACEPQATYPTIRNVERIALDGPVFVNGMVFDASRFTVTAFFNDGHSEDVTASAKIDGTDWDTKGLVKATLSTASYAGTEYDVTTEKTFDKVPATGYEFSQAAWTIEATADNATKPTKWTYDYASLKAELIESLESGDVTVTASYKDGSIALSVKDVTNILSGSTSFEFANAKELADYGLTSDKGAVTSTKFVDIPVELSLVVGSGKAVVTNISITAEDVTEADANTKIARIAVAVVKDNSVSADKIEIINNPYVDEGKVAVLAYNSDNEIVDVLTASAEYKVLGDALPTSTLPLADEAAEGMVYLVADPSISVPYSISGQDYIKSIAVEKDNVTITAGNNYSIDSVGKVIGTYASSTHDKPKAVVVTGDTPTISIPANAEAQSSYLTVKVTYVNEKGTTLSDDVTISIAKASAGGQG